MLAFPYSFPAFLILIYKNKLSLYAVHFPFCQGPAFTRLFQTDICGHRSVLGMVVNQRKSIRPFGAAWSPILCVWGQVFIHSSFTETICKVKRMWTHQRWCKDLTCSVKILMYWWHLWETEAIAEVLLTYLLSPSGRHLGRRIPPVVQIVPVFT